MSIDVQAPFSIRRAEQAAPSETPVAVQSGLFVDGAFVAPGDGDVLDVVDPCSGRTVAQVSAGTRRFLFNDNPVDDDLSGAHFPAGPRTVAGHDALAFVRQRHGLPQGDLDRIRRQQAFLASMSHKVLSSGTLADPLTLTRLLDAVRQSVVLDGDWDLLRFGQQLQDVSAGAVAFLTIPTMGTRNVDVIEKEG